MPLLLTELSSSSLGFSQQPWISCPILQGVKLSLREEMSFSRSQVRKGKSYIVCHSLCGEGLAPTFP